MKLILSINITELDISKTLSFINVINTEIINKIF